MEDLSGEQYQVSLYSPIEEEFDENGVSPSSPADDDDDDRQNMTNSDDFEMEELFGEEAEIEELEEGVTDPSKSSLVAYGLLIRR
jgi:hypothetical protein